MTQEQLNREPSHDRPEPPREVHIRYRKSNLARVIHVDGAWGGIMSQGLIFMSLYNEHPTPPDEIVVRRDQQPRPSTALPFSGITREIEAEVVMSLEVAIALRDWINNKIDVLQQLSKRVEEQSSTRAQQGEQR